MSSAAEICLANPTLEPSLGVVGPAAAGILFSCHEDGSFLVSIVPVLWLNSRKKTTEHRRRSGCQILVIKGYTRFIIETVNREDWPRARNNEINGQQEPHPSVV